MASALGRFLSARSDHPVVIVGRDTRSSGWSLAAVLQAGMLREGIDVIDLGVMTTPGVAYLTRCQAVDLGVVVSASHNPPEYNGIKVVGPDGLRLQREDEIEIESLIDKCVSDSPAGGARAGEQIDGRHLLELYVQDHVQRLQVESLRSLRIVLDCAHGAAARVAPQVFRRLGAQVSVANHDSGGKSINQGAGSEFVRQHPASLAQMVRRSDAVCGFAFDGDGDRLVVVDADGAVYDGDDILFALAGVFDRRGLLRGRTVVTSHAANRGLDSALAGLGINLVRAGKGDKAIEAAMWRGDYFLGGEQFGNIIINDGFHTSADAVLTALSLSAILLDGKPSFSEMVGPLLKRPQVVASVRFDATRSLELPLTLQRQRSLSEATLGDDCRIVTWNSSTEPGLFRAMVEGGADSLLVDVRREAISLCRAFQECVGAPDSLLEVFEVSSRFRD